MHHRSRTTSLTAPRASSARVGLPRRKPDCAAHSTGGPPRGMVAAAAGRAASWLPPSVEPPTPPRERSRWPAAPPLLLPPALPSSPTRSTYSNSEELLRRHWAAGHSWLETGKMVRTSVSPYHGKMHGITLDFLLDPIPRDDARFRSPCLRRGHDQSDPPLWGILISCLLFPKVK